jgi:hypothetical protein
LGARGWLCLGFRNWCQHGRFAGRMVVVMIDINMHRTQSVRIGKPKRFEDENGLLKFVCRKITVTDEDGNPTEINIFSKEECTLEIEA